MDLFWLLIGFLAGAPLWVALSILAVRRMLRTARRLSARTKGREHLAELGQLAGGLAHEIKNPLSTINVNLELLSEDLSRSDDELHGRWLRRLEGVQTEVGRLRRILEDFLHYAKHFEMDLQPLDLRVLVEELVDFFAPQAEAGGVIMRISLPEEPLPCRLDAALIKQGLLNLMINAVQAMDAGGELLIRLARRRDQAVIELIDTGVGIDPKHLPHVFEVYYSTKSGGSGLGLSTTRRILHEHGGTITCQSDPGKGTRFILSVPLCER